MSGPPELQRQERAGFYEYGAGTDPPVEDAVAYVARRDQLADIPASVRDLPVVKSEIVSGEPGWESIVVFGPHAALFLGGSNNETAGGHAPAGAGKVARRPQGRAKAAYHQECENGYFCLYNCNDFNHPCGSELGTRLKLGSAYNGEGWFALSNFAFNDKANSMQNIRANDSLLAQHWNPPYGTGTKYCAESKSIDSYLSNNPIGENEASAFKNSTRDDHC